jgi:hypothetical protein
MLSRNGLRTRRLGASPKLERKFYNGKCLTETESTVGNRLGFVYTVSLRWPATEDGWQSLCADCCREVLKVEPTDDLALQPIDHGRRSRRKWRRWWLAFLSRVNKAPGVHLRRGDKRISRLSGAPIACTPNATTRPQVRWVVANLRDVTVLRICPRRNRRRPAGSRRPTRLRSPGPSTTWPSRPHSRTGSGPAARS